MCVSECEIERWPKVTVKVLAKIHNELSVSPLAEILGGIILGPTGFGSIPGITDTIFPESSLTVLDTAANVGLIFFLFLVGLELNIKTIVKYGRDPIPIWTQLLQFKIVNTVWACDDYPHKRGQNLMNCDVK